MMFLVGEDFESARGDIPPLVLERISFVAL